MTEPTRSRWIFRLAYAVYGVAVGVYAATAPDRVPTHFTASGRPDAFQDRTTAVVVWIAIGFVIIMLFALLALNAPRLSWSLINLPHKNWWAASAAREARLRAILATDLWRLGAATVLLLAAMVGSTLVAARSPDQRMASWSWLVIITYLAIVGGYLTYQIRYRFNPDRVPVEE